MRCLTGLLIVFSLLCIGCGSPAPPAAPAPNAGAVGPPGVAPPGSVSPPGVAPPGVAPPGVMPPGAGVASTGTPASRAATVAPFLDDQTVAIMRIDVAAINVDTAFTEFAKIVATLDGEDAAKLLRADADKVLAFQKLVQEVYVVVSLNDAPAYPPFGVVKMVPGADAKKIFAFWHSEDVNAAVDQKAFDEFCFVKNDVAILGNGRAIYRFKNSTAPPTVVPNLEQAFQLAGNTQFQAIFVPTDGARAALAKTAQSLPAQLVSDAETLMTSVNYAAVTTNLPPGFELKIEAQGRDAASAQKVQAAMSKFMAMLRVGPNMSPFMQGIFDKLSPQLNNDRLTCALRESDVDMVQLKAMALGAASTFGPSPESQVTNNLKQIGLAMHNYAAQQGGKLPAARPMGPGLSWRVHLLPFLEETALYQQFKLNEPWDSPANKPLIEKMPAVFANPKARTSGPGMTTFVVPVGDTTAFPASGPIAITDLADGSSNTLMVVEVNGDKAVTWTKPDDWQPDVATLFNDLGVNWSNGIFHVLLCDGAVRPLTKSLEPEQFRRMIVRNDAQPIDWAQVDVIIAGARSPGPPSPFAALAGFGLPGMGGVPGGVVPPVIPPRDPLGGPVNPLNPMPGGPQNPNIPGGPNNPNGLPVSNDPPLIAQAKRSFAAGQDNDGMEFLMGEALIGEDKDGLKSNLKWAAALKRPTLAIRWGLGIQYTTTRNYGGGPAPIGRPSTGPPPAPQPNAQATDPAAPQANAPPTKVIDYYTAELGTKLVEGLRTRVDDGQFGEVLKAYGPNAGGAPGVPGQGPIGVGIGVGDPNGAAAKALAGKPMAIVPGVVFVGMERGGTASQRDLINRAKQEQLDVLVIFDVNVSPTRTTVQNSTKIMLYDLSKGESLHASKILKNVVVEAARKDAKGDPVEEVIERFFTVVDSTFKLEDLPAALNEGNVTARVQKLTDSPPTNKLATLLEIAFWQDRGLLSAENAQAATEKILGPAASDPAKRKAAIEKLLPKSVGAAGDPGRRLGIGP
jgi:hypothetical protein